MSRTRAVFHGLRTRILTFPKKFNRIEVGYLIKDKNDPETMIIRECSIGQTEEIRSILNEAIVNSTALYDYKPRSHAAMEAWFETKQKGGYPVLGAFHDSGSLLGFASFGAFRAWPAYKYSVEHSVYIRSDARGQGVGFRLLSELILCAVQRDYHMMIGGIDSTNQASLGLHKKLGFSHCASIKQAGFKFGRWLDLEFFQLLLPTPHEPNEE